MNQIYNIGDLKKAIEGLDNNDELVIEIHEGERNEGLYTPYLDIIDNLALANGNIIKEIRLCI